MCGADNGAGVAYKPHAGFVGVDRFTYVPVRAHGFAPAGTPLQGTGEVTVTVTVVAKAPVARGAPALAPAMTAVAASGHGNGALADVGADGSLLSGVTMPVDTRLAAELFLEPAGRNGHPSGMGPLGSASMPLTRLTTPTFNLPGGEAISSGLQRPSPRFISNRLLAQHAPLPSSGGLNDLASWFGAMVWLDADGSWRMHNLRTPSGGAAGGMEGDNIPVPPGDPQWDAGGTGGVTMPFHRAPALTVSATSGPTRGMKWRQPINPVTHLLDLHPVYGSTAERATAVRVGPQDELGPATPSLAALRLQVVDEGGGATVDATAAARGAVDTVLPPNDRGIANVNPYHKAPHTLLLGGDDRVNLMPGTIALATAFARRHNALLPTLISSAAVRAAVEQTTGTWGATHGRDGIPARPDDLLFAVTQAVVRAEYQAIAWYEWLPAMIGPAAFARMPPYRGFNESVDPAISCEAAASALAVWLSQLGGAVARMAPDGTSLPALQLRDAWFAPHRVTLGGGVDALLRGAAAAVSQEVDVLFHDAVRNDFVGWNVQGLDFAALQLQRGRDMGVPPYVTVVAAQGRTPPANMTELVALARLPARVAARVQGRLEEVYGHAVEQVDLLVGALLEAHLPGGAVGATMAGLLVDAMVRLRDGDRYWFENPQSPVAGILHAVRSPAQWQRVTLAGTVLSSTVPHFHDPTPQPDAAAASALTANGGSSGRSPATSADSFHAFNPASPAPRSGGGATAPEPVLGGVAAAATAAAAGVAG